MIYVDFADVLCVTLPVFIASVNVFVCILLLFTHLNTILFNFFGSLALSASIAYPWIIL